MPAARKKAESTWKKSRAWYTRARSYPRGMTMNLRAGRRVGVLALGPLIELPLGADAVGGVPRPQHVNRAGDAGALVLLQHGGVAWWDLDRHRDGGSPGLGSEPLELLDPRDHLIVGRDPVGEPGIAEGQHPLQHVRPVAADQHRRMRFLQRRRAADDPVEV